MNVSRPNSLVQLHRQLSDLSDQMLAAAQAKGWMNVLALGQRYTETLEALRSVDRSGVLTGEEMELRYRLLLRIIDNDARTRRLVQPADAKLDKLLSVSSALPGAHEREEASQ